MGGDGRWRGPPCLKPGEVEGRKRDGFTHLLCSHGVDGDSSAGFVVMVGGGGERDEIQPVAEGLACACSLSLRPPHKDGGGEGPEDDGQDDLPKEAIPGPWQLCPHTSPPLLFYPSLFPSLPLGGKQGPGGGKGALLAGSWREEGAFRTAHLTRGSPAPLIWDGALALPMRGATSSSPPPPLLLAPPPLLPTTEIFLNCPNTHPPLFKCRQTTPLAKPTPHSSGWLEEEEEEEEEQEEEEEGALHPFLACYSKNSIHFGAPEWGGSQRARRKRSLSPPRSTIVSSPSPL